MERTISERVRISARNLFVRLRRIGHRLRGKQDHEVKSFIQTRVRKNGTAQFPRIRQFRYLARVLSSKERRTVSIAFLVAGIAAIAFAVLTYATVWEPVPARGGEYREALVGKPKFLNPVLAPANDVDLDLTRLIYAGLVRFDPTEHLAPDLAESFEVSSDQKVYTFRLRKNVKWHDGEPFDADDVVFTVRTIQDPLVKSPLALSLAGVKADKIDQHTVRFSLPEPFAPFLSLLQFGILPEHRWFDIPPDQFALANLNLEQPIGTGPYRVVSFVKDKRGGVRSYTLEAFDGYYDHPYIARMIFKFYPTFQEAVDAVRAGEVDGLSFLPRELIPSLSDTSTLAFNRLSLPQYTALFYNQKRTPALRDVRARKALGHAIDREDILQKALEGDGAIIDVPLLPGFVGHDPDVGRVPFDTAKANALFEEAGWKRSEPSVYEAAMREKDETFVGPPEPSLAFYRKKGDEFLNLTITTVDQTTNASIAEEVKRAWEAVGVITNLELVGREQIAKQIIDPRAYQILLYGEIIGSDPDPFPFWHSSQASAPGLNLALFENKHADRLLEEARATAQPDERAAKYLEFQKILSREAPATFLFQPTYTYVVGRSVKGITIDRITQPSDRFARATDWYIKTKRRPRRD